MNHRPYEKAPRHEQYDYFYRQRPGDSPTHPTITKTVIPPTVQPGRLIRVDVNYDGVNMSKVEFIDMKGKVNSSMAPTSDPKMYIVLITKVDFQQGILEGLVGEDLMRFSGKFLLYELGHGLND